MSMNPHFGNKRRSSTMLYTVDQAQVSRPTCAFQGTSARSRNSSHSAALLPSKRHRGLETKLPQGHEDPFGDNEDFTADDLEEIEILATQALTQGLNQANSSKNTETITATGTRVTGSFADENLKGRESRFLNAALDSSEKRRAGSFMGIPKDVDTFAFEVLQEQHDELKQKLQKMQEDLLMKNGEIKVLRDSLRSTESDLEHQRMSIVVLEKEKEQQLTAKEKELNRKMQALESELHFKNAEMNELRIKLQNCERMAKSSTPISTKLSPREKTTGISTLDGCVSSQTGKNSFLTTAAFATERSPKCSSEGARRCHSFSIIKRDDKGVQTVCVEEHKDLEDKHFCAPFQRLKLQMKGSALLSTLFRESIAPGPLGLCHLLSLSTEAMSGALGQHTCFSSISSGKLISRTNRSGNVALQTLTECRNLAVTGLNMLTVEQGQSEQDISCTGQICALAGAVHLLPLVEYYVSLYCQTLEAQENLVKSPRSLCPNSEGSTVVNAENQCGLEDFALTALGVLYHLTFHSRDVVRHLLSPVNSASTKPAQTAEIRKMQTASCFPTDADPGPSKVQDEELVVPPKYVQDGPYLHPLLRKLLQLMDPSFIGTSNRRETFICQSLKVLVKLAENSTLELLPRFQVLMSSSLLLKCLGHNSPCSAVCTTVHLMAIFIEHSRLAASFFSHSEDCPLLHLCTYVTSRPDRSAFESQWHQLESEVVRFFMKFYTYNSSTVLDSECRCSGEVVKTVTVMLHRHWLNVRKCERNLSSLGHSAVQFLQDTVLLLHCLSQKDKNFTEHCLDVLHQYDQVIPGIKAIFRRITDLKESEEIALEELCPPEPDVEEQEMETGF
ncbi:ATR-interacting protein isoform X2 [Protopterus annectens]|uniref:ATR-interacting protein isoform X2 n=1 Tax=Protopterus annectens TaxID=7888 RepID=UPI001CFAC6BA|nr:ATR-interacting protein isoform X2 [Protopterus annectens]